MKTPSRIFAFVVLGVIAMVAVVSCCYFPFIPDIASYCVEIGSKQKRPPYVEWKDRGQFEKALQQVCDHQGEYDLFVLLQDKDEHPEHWKKRCNSNPPVNIRTVKVTKSKAAERAAAGESVANDPNVTWRVASSHPEDIKAVLDALKP